MLSFRCTFIYALLAILASLTPAAADDGCVADWGKAGEIVRQNGLATVEQLSKTPGAVSGQIVKATLCAEAGGYVYRLVVRDGAGQLKNVVVEARNHAKAQK